MTPAIRTGASCFALASLLAGTAANGQTTDAGYDGDGQDIIIVTGEKLNRTLDETNSSVVVYTGEELEDRGVDDVYDAVLRTPNVSQSFGEKGFAIRGIDQRFGAGAGLLVTTIVDGASLPNNQATFFGPYSAWDIGQIEILRGPQGTTQGRNAVGGAIIVNTADPEIGVLEGRARASYAELDSYQLAGALNVPLGDMFAARFAVDQRESDGYVFNPTRDEEYDRRESLTARGKLLFQPGTDFSALYTISYTDSTGGEDLVDYTRFPEERVNLSDNVALEGSEHLINTLELDYDFSDAVSLTSISTYYTQDYIRIEDFDNSPVPAALVDRGQEDDAFTQEVRVNYDDGGRFRGVVGGYFFTYDSQVVDTVIVPTAFVGPLPDGLITQLRTIDNEEENIAVFGEVEFDVTDRLTLIAGARYDHESRGTEALAQTSAVAADPAQQPVLDAILAQLAPDELIATDTEYDAFLPKAGLRYELSDQVTVGFTAQRAYRAGGTGISTITGTVAPYDPEYTWTYEASVRATTVDGTFSLSANAFYTDWTDQIVNQIIDPRFPQDLIPVNAGESRLFGAEIQMEARPSRTLTVFGGLGLLDTKFTDYVTDNAEYTGNEFSYAPAVNVTAGFDYRHPTGFRALGDVNLMGSQYATTSNDPTRTTLIPIVDDSGAVVGQQESCSLEPCNDPQFFVPGYVVVNLRVGYEAENWSLFAFARNLLDEDYITQQLPGDFGPLARTAEPRVAGVEMTVRF